MTSAVRKELAVSDVTWNLLDQETTAPHVAAVKGVN
jgi:hypothetical protein